VLASGTICRARGASVCDLDDLCTGGVTCPVRAANAGTVCRAAVNTCDVQEVCDGTSEACPANTFAANTVPCGAVPYTGPGQSPANCSGINGGCGGATPNLVCDIANTCSGTAATCTRCSCSCEP
jgi:hypothetical protein